jgi:hypothetical protein
MLVVMAANTRQMIDRIRILSFQRWHCRDPQLAISLLDLTAAIDDKINFLAVFHGLDGYAFGRRLAFSDLGIAGGLKLGDKFLLRQCVSWDEPARHNQAKDHE